MNGILLTSSIGGYGNAIVLTGLFRAVPRHCSVDFAHCHVRRVASMVRLTLQQRWKIIACMEVSGGNVAYTSVNVPCHIRQVRRWWKTYQTTKDVVDASRSGRPRLLSDGAADVALDLLLHEDTSGASQVAQQLAVQGLTNKVVNRSTIIRAARMAATRRGELLVNKRGKPTKGMTAKTKAKRLAFARAYKGHPWDLTVFTCRQKEVLLSLPWVQGQSFQMAA